MSRILPGIRLTVLVTTSVAALALGLSGCNCTGTVTNSDAGGPPPGDSAPGLDSGPLGSCPYGTDLDGDGHGMGCPGFDCDDSDFNSYDGAPELCDGRDNDCDSQIDEGVTNECGNCNPNCDTNTVGMNPFPQPTDMPPPNNVDADGVGNDANGDVVLDSTNISFHFAWIANNAEGTVSKLDTDTGSEVGRYDSVYLVDVPTARPPQEPCGGSTGNCPSRTAVDFNGDVWVANRAFNNQGSATKIGNEVVSCFDRNLNGFIDTSSDHNGNLIIDVDCDGNGIFDTGATVCTNGLPPEFLGQDDECLLLSAPIGAPGAAGPRALAIDAGGGPGSPGSVWVGHYSEQAFYKLDGDTGALLARVPPTGGMGVSPYGAAIDSTGKLWAPNGCCGGNTLIDIDTNTNTVGTIRTRPALACGGSYGIAVDGNDHVWLGGYPCPGAFVYEPPTDTWTYVDTGEAGFGGRGIGVDGFGRAWVALHLVSPGSMAKVASIDVATRTPLNVFDIFGATGGQVPVGAGVAFDGSIWAINQSSSTAARIYIDPTTGTAGPHPVTGNMIDEFPVGASPYTYSDFTGFGLRNFTNPNGTYSFWVEGCADPAEATWHRVEWNATEPPGTAIQVSVRTANTVPGLDTATTSGTWSSSPAFVDSPPGPVTPNPARYLEVIFDLTTLDPTTTPVLHDVNIVWECPNNIG